MSILSCDGAGKSRAYARTLEARAHGTQQAERWLAELLHLRSATDVSSLLRRVKAAGGERRELFPKGLRQILRKPPPIIKN